MYTNVKSVGEIGQAQDRLTNKDNSRKKKNGWCQTEWDVEQLPQRFDGTDPAYPEAVEVWQVHGFTLCFAVHNLTTTDLTGTSVRYLSVPQRRLAVQVPS